MSASSPAKSVTPEADATAAAAFSPLSSAGSKSLRGLNKPKCIKCGNVARSRCPYQSCKSCCAKAQNPCHIHVLKGNSSLPDKAPSSGSPLFDQQSTEVSHSGSNQRLRQLSNNFAQFSNLQAPLRSRKPLTRKDAQIINEWRFLKLKEFRDGNIEAENEAFDRYMQNTSLLEEVFAANSESNSDSVEENNEKFFQGLKLKLKSNQARTDNFRKRVQNIVDQVLSKRTKFETNDQIDTEGPTENSKTSDLSDLIDKLNQARNEEDLKACWEIACPIFGWNSKKQSSDLKSIEHNGKWVNPTSVDQEALCRIDAHFSSLEEIEDL